MDKQPRILTGALIGGLLTAPLLALFYLGNALLGLPFAAFDFFNVVRDALPGGLLTFGIDSMKFIIETFNIGRVDQVAKLAEQLMALIFLLVGGVIAGGVFFLINNLIRRRRKQDLAFSFPIILGAAGGALTGIVMVIVVITAGTSASPEMQNSLLSVFWVFGLFLAWGTALGWIYSDLSAIHEGDTYINTEGVQKPVEVINRRQFLVRVGGATAALTVVGAGLGALLSSGEGEEAISTSLPPRTEGTPEPGGAVAQAENVAWSEANPLPNADAQPAPAPGTRPELTPVPEHYRIDISLSPPRIDGATWALTIGGLVDTPLTLTLDNLVNDYEPMHQFITQGCISNSIAGSLISTQRWTGVSMQTLLDSVGVKPEGRFLKITSADGFHEVVELDLIGRDPSIMLTYAWDGQPLPVRNGYPVRIHIPNVYGMKQPKWITGMEVVADYEEGYWVRRGWDAVARVQTTSVIDTVATEAAYQRDGITYVPIGGIAWAGSRGISNVEVRVDDGEWQPAELRTPLSKKTWVLWRYDWPFEQGGHTFAVRCVDGLAIPQTETQQGVRPSGATGIHSVVRHVSLS